MSEYLIAYSEEDRGYIVTFPDFPGISAYGETKEDALKEAKVVLKLATETKIEEEQYDRKFFNMDFYRCISSFWLCYVRICICTIVDIYNFRIFKRHNTYYYIRIYTYFYAYNFSYWVFFQCKHIVSNIRLVIT